MITIILAIFLIIESVIIIWLSSTKASNQLEVKPGQIVKINNARVICKEGGTCRDCCLRDTHVCALMKCSDRTDKKFIYFEEEESK